jgi:hypothetical protein
VLKLPRGKELEQLPMANTLPGMGEDKTKFNREILSGVTGADRPHPAKVTDKRKS